MKAITGLCLASILTALTPASLIAQTRWFKYTGNPVMGPGPLGSWDQRTVFPSRVLRLDSIFVMWYTGWDGGRWRMGMATSADGVTWTKNSHNPVFGEGLSPWEVGGCSEAYVLPYDSGYHMWYMGEDYSENWRIGFATSPDGISWTRSPGGKPVLGPGPWYARGPHSPSVLPHRVVPFVMWFTGDPFPHADFQIGFAQAYDETTWFADPDPALTFGPPGAWDDDKVFSPRVIRVDGTYEMWYCGETNNGRTDIGYAVTSSLRNWTKDASNPVLRRGTGWDAFDIYSMDVLYSDGLYHMWYGGCPSLLQFQVGYAISPRGLSYSVLPVGGGLDRNHDTVRVVVRAEVPSRLSFFVEIESRGGVLVDTFALFDDGAHGDSLASDGVFSNTWIPGGLSLYSMDLKTRLHDSLTFEMTDIATFSPVVEVDAEERPSHPEAFTLSQNYPNPFNPISVIEYGIPPAPQTTPERASDRSGGGSHRVRLVIYDLLGREVAVLVDERKAPGTYSVRFDGSGLPSGVYYYRLTAGPVVLTKRMTLMR